MRDGGQHEWELVRTKIGMCSSGRSGGSLGLAHGIKKRGCNKANLMNLDRSLQDSLGKADSPQHPKQKSKAYQ